MLLVATSNPIHSRMSEAPIIFVHYGASSYLRKALLAAARSNPAKRIFLLGDDTNRSLARGAASFVDCRDFDGTAKLAAFDRIFTPLEGRRHRFNKPGGTGQWLRFVFRRWFLVEEFLCREQIDRFWTFDSDTLILAPLASREARFAGLECTTQCRDCCLNGFIASRALVECYTRAMSSFFLDAPFMARQKQRLEKQSGLAFNEMDAFGEFRRREKVRALHAAQPVDGEFFDDALAYDANFEASPVKIAGRIPVKRLWISPDRALYARHLASGRFVRMITCNLSWLPDYVWSKFTPYCLTPEQDAKVKPPVESELREVDLSQPLTDRIATALKRKVFELKRAAGGR